MVRLARFITVFLAGSVLSACTGAEPTPSATASADAAATATTTASASGTVPITTDFDGAILYGDGGDLRVVDSAGEKPLTTTDWSEWAPSWSPDGSAIVFASDEGGSVDLYRIEADGSNVQRLTTTPENEGAADWSPDGGRIAFVTFADPGGGTVWVMNADGTDLTEVYKDAHAFIGIQEWSADGRLTLSIDKAGGGELDLYAIESDGANLTALVTNPGDDTGGRWSRDGTKMVFWSDSGPGNEGPGIYVMSPDGTGTNKLYADAFGLDTVSLAWSPDEQEIAWTGKYEGGGGTPIYLISAGGGNLQQVTAALREISRLGWH
jgi:Tol biopolymer transport system component